MWVRLEVAAMMRAIWCAFEALPAAKETAIVEHIFTLRIQCPVVALTRIARFTGDLHETVVQA